MITKELIEEFRADFKVAVEELQKKHNCTVKMGNVRYSNTSFTFKTEARFANEDGEIEDEYREDWKRFVPIIENLKVEWLDREFTHRGTNYKIVGYRPKASKYPVVGETSDGGKVCFQAKQIIREMEDEA